MTNTGIWKSEKKFECKQNEDLKFYTKKQIKRSFSSSFFGKICPQADGPHAYKHISIELIAD